MPTGNYSYNSWQQRDEPQGSYAITEPEGHSAGMGQSQAAARQSSQRVQAKEPERQSASRRKTQSGRGRAASVEEESQPRSRTASRGAARRGTQARRATGGQTARRTASAEPRTGRAKKSRRGFAAMSPEQQREIARKGGLTVSRNRRHMADIGRIGGEHSHGGRRARR